MDERRENQKALRKRQALEGGQTAVSSLPLPERVFARPGIPKAHGAPAPPESHHTLHWVLIRAGWD